MPTKMNTETGAELEQNAQPTGEAPAAASIADRPGNDIHGVLRQLAMQISETSERQGQTMEEVRAYLSMLGGRGGAQPAKAPGECSASFARLEESLKGLARKMNELGVSVDDEPATKAVAAAAEVNTAAADEYLQETVALDAETAAEAVGDYEAEAGAEDFVEAVFADESDLATSVESNHDQSDELEQAATFEEVEFHSNEDQATGTETALNKLGLAENADFKNPAHARYMTDIGATSNEDLYRIYGAVARAYDAIAEAISEDAPEASEAPQLRADEAPQAWRFEDAAPVFASTSAPATAPAVAAARPSSAIAQAEDGGADTWDETSAAALMSVYEELPADDVYYPQAAHVTPAAAAVRVQAGSRRVENGPAVLAGSGDAAAVIADTQHAEAGSEAGAEFDAFEGDVELSFAPHACENNSIETNGAMPEAPAENFRSYALDMQGGDVENNEQTDHDAGHDDDIAWFEQRFDDLANRIDDVAAAQPGNEVMDQLRVRLDDIETMISQIPQQGSDREVLEVIDGKIDELHNNLERAVAEIERIEIIEDHIAQLIDELGRSHGNLDTVVTAATEKAFEKLAPDFAAGQAQALALSGDPVADKRLDQMMELMQSYIADRRDNEDQTAQVLEAIHAAVAELSDRIAAFDSLEAAEEHDAGISAEEAAMQLAAEQKAARAEQLAAAKKSALAAQAKVAASDYPAGLIDNDDAVEADSFGEAVAAVRPAAHAVASEPLQRRSVLSGLTEQAPAYGAERAAAAPQRASMSASLGREDMIAQARRAAQAAAAEAAAKAAEPSKRQSAAAAKAERKDRAGSALNRSMLVVGKSNPRPVLVAAIFALVLAGAGMLYSKLNRAPAPHSAIEQTMTSPKAVAPERQTPPVTTEDDELKKSELYLNNDGELAQRNAMLSGNGLGSDVQRPNMSGVSVLTAVDQFGTSYADENGTPTTNVALSLPQDQPVPVAAGGEIAMPLDLPPARIAPLSLRLAAAKGEPQAQFEIGSRFAQGQGVERDFVQAANWFERAASKGHAPAQYRLGALYERGKGVAEDVDRARIWYGRAAQAGNVKAMHNLAVLYAGQQNGGPDYVIASQWFTKAAERGLADSQFNLGILYDNGLGVARSDIKAYQWYSLAARQGDQEAVKQQDILRQRMQPDAIAAVDRIVASWRAAPRDPNANESEAAIEAWSRAPSEADQPMVASAPVKATTGQIAKAQLLLSRLGYNVGAIDGQMGPRTREAIRTFQGKMGAGSGDEVSPELLTMLSAQAS